MKLPEFKRRLATLHKAAQKLADEKKRHDAAWRTLEATRIQKATPVWEEVRRHLIEDVFPALEWEREMDDPRYDVENTWAAHYEAKLEDLTPVLEVMIPQADEVRKKKSNYGSLLNIDFRLVVNQKKRIYFTTTARIFPDDGKFLIRLHATVDGLDENKMMKKLGLAKGKKAYLLAKQKHQLVRMETERRSLASKITVAKKKLAELEAA